MKATHRYQSSPFAPPSAYRGCNMTLRGIELADVRMYHAMGYFRSTNQPRWVTQARIVWCRVCGSRDKIICWAPDDHRAAICPDCCATAEHPDGESGHQFDFYPQVRQHDCRYCGIDRNCTDWRPDDEF